MIALRWLLLKISVISASAILCNFEKAGHAHFADPCGLHQKARKNAERPCAK
jgi:hypothetical protein